MKQHLLWTVVLVFAAVSPSYAQSRDGALPIQVGDRVRLRFDGDPTTTVGTVTDLGPNELRVHTPAPYCGESGCGDLVAPLDRLASLEVSRISGERRLVTWLGVAAAAGLLLGPIYDGRCDGSRGDGLTSMRCGLPVLGGTAAAVTLGFLLTRDRWRPVLVP
ncbi:MAG TPA: hypothetical protein VFQ38_09510 [Longimicrobiales bacterium]|nr:hypothetical protein [Longimicrobiales bacterium]